MRGWTCMAASLAVALAAAPARAQTDEEYEIARQAYMTGEQLFAEGRFQEALAAFQQSYDIVQYADTVYNLAACYEAVGQNAEAQTRYQAIIDSPDVSEDLRTQAQQSLQRLAAATPGQPPVQYPPGQYPPGQYPPAQAGGGLSRRTVSTIWDAVDREVPHEGPAGYLFIGGAGPMNGGTVADNTTAGVWGGAGFLWRIISHLSLLGEIGFALPDVEYYDDVALTWESQSTYFIDIAFGLRYHILGSGFWDPWIDAGVGWSRWTNAADPGSTSENYYNAALVKIGAGLDLFVTQFIALGPRFDALVPVWLDSAGVTCATDLCFQDHDVAGSVATDVERSDLPFFWAASVTATLYFMSI